MTSTIANRYRHDQNRGTQCLAGDWTTDRRSALHECANQEILVAEIDADPLRQQWSNGNGHAVCLVSHDSVVEQAVQHITLLKEFLQRCRFPDQRGLYGVGNQLKRTDAVLQLAINVCRHKRRRRELLLPEQSFHVLA